MSAHPFNTDGSFVLSFFVSLCHFVHPSQMQYFCFQYLSYRWFFFHFPRTSYSGMHRSRVWSTRARIEFMHTQSQNNKKAAYQVLTTFFSFRSNFLSVAVSISLFAMSCVRHIDKADGAEKIPFFRSLCRYVMAKRDRNLQNENECKEKKMTYHIWHPIFLWKYKIRIWNYFYHTASIRWTVVVHDRPSMFSSMWWKEEHWTNERT